MEKHNMARTAPGIVTPGQLHLDLDDQNTDAAGPVNPCATFSAKSTATEVQIEKLIALTQARPHHTHELRKMGISHPAGRILDLEKRGFVYQTRRITTVDSDGFPHRGVALYKLVSVPVPAQGRA